MKKLVVGAQLFWRRCRVVPFEVALSVLAVWTGMVSFMGWNLTSRAMLNSLPENVARGLNLMYLISGVLIFAGVGWAYRNIEVSGLILLATSFLIRMLVLISVVGLTPETTMSVVQSLTFGLACILRLHCILKNCILVFASDIPEIVARQAQAQRIPL